MERLGGGPSDRVAVEGDACRESIPLSLILSEVEGRGGLVGRTDLYPSTSLRMRAYWADNLSQLEVDMT